MVLKPREKTDGGSLREEYPEVAFEQWNEQEQSLVESTGMSLRYRRRGIGSYIWSCIGRARRRFSEFRW